MPSLSFLIESILKRHREVNAPIKMALPHVAKHANIQLREACGKWKRRQWNDTLGERKGFVYHFLLIGIIYEMMCKGRWYFRTIENLKGHHLKGIHSCKDCFFPFLHDWIHDFYPSACWDKVKPRFYLNDDLLSGIRLIGESLHLCSFVT